MDSSFSILFNNFKSFLDHRNDSRLLFQLPMDPPFDDWNINQRYCSADLIDEERVKLRQMWTDECVQLLKGRNLNGGL